MIADLDEAPQDELPDYDLCIIGSGPAGMTVANELAGAGLRICVLESGRLKTTRHGDALRRALSEGIHIKDYSRERVFGGASTTWAGLSSPLDPADMERRSYLAHSGWPITRDELLPYYASAAERYRFPPLSFFGSDGFGVLRGRGTLRPEWGEVEEKVFLACSEPQDFAKEHRHVFDEGGADLYLDATVTRLVSAPGTRRIAHAAVRTRGGRELLVKARVFVVGTGGIENARLLLNSRDLCEAGLGNEHDQVGRFLMNHPKNYYGILTLERPVEDLPYYFGCLYEGYAGYGGIRFPESELRRRGLMNSYVRLEPLFPWSDNDGIESLVTLVKRTQFLLKSFKARKKGKVVSLRDYSETGDDSDLQNERKTAAGWLALVWKVAVNSPRVAQYLYYRLVARSKLRIKTARLRNFMEMEPDPENRVVLSPEVDLYGQPLPLVLHRCSDLDKRSLVELHEVLREEFRRAGFGTLETALASEEEWPITQDASHHMGTTRMGDDPARSVVDQHCRIHGVDNVFVAGASVFPTSGCANPTFTLVALAIRLAENLRENALRPETLRAT